MASTYTAVRMQKSYSLTGEENVSNTLKMFTRSDSEIPLFRIYPKPAYKYLYTKIFISALFPK